jgi:hypothetical protein
MAQLSSIASLVATGVSTYATISQAQKQDSYRKEQRAAAARQAEAQDRQAQIALAEKARERSAALRRTIAAARAARRLGCEAGRGFLGRADGGAAAGRGGAGGGRRDLRGAALRRAA